MLNDLFKYRDKIIDAFKGSTFLSDYAAYGYVLM